MKRIVICIFCAAGILLAGQNSSAKLFIDTDPISLQADTVRHCLQDSAFTVVIKVTDAVQLYGYQVYLQYDTSKLVFVTASKGDAVSPNFLETKGGSLIFTAKKSLNDSTKILIAGSILGGDLTQCAVGSGTLALATFKMKKADTTLLSLSNPMILDFNEITDETLQLDGARIIPGTDRVIFRKISDNTFRKLEFFKDRVNITLSDMSRADISVVDVKGRVISRQTVRSNQLSMDLTNTGAGIFILKVAQNNRISSASFIIK